MDKTRTIRFAAVLALLATFPLSLSARVWINEVQSVNETTVLDETGENLDWIELYNDGDVDVSLGGWGLSDKAKKPYKYIFPSDAVVPARGYLRVFAGGVATGELEPETAILPDDTAVVGDLVGWYRADEALAIFGTGQNVTRFSDASVFGNALTNENIRGYPPPTVSENALGTHAALSFNYSARNSVILDSAGFNGINSYSNLTFIALARVAMTSSVGLMGLDPGNAAKIQLNVNNGVVEYKNGPSSAMVKSETVVVTNQWTVFSCRTDGTRESIRSTVEVDGKIVGESSSNQMPPAFGGAFTLGKGKQFFGGDMVEVMLFRRALTDAELKGLVAGLRTKYELGGDARNFHTGFSLSSEGESLLLTPQAVDSAVTPSAEDTLSFGTVPCDTSYGRCPDGSSTLGWFALPTPGARNAEGCFPELVTPVSFSVERGLYSEPFDLVLSHDDPEVTILYTTDHSEPSIENGVTNGLVYTAPIHISGTTAVRAVPVKDDALPCRNVVTHTYLYLDAVPDQVKPACAPDVWSDRGTTSASYSISPNVVSNEETRAELRQALKAIPIVSVTLSDVAMFDPEVGLYSKPSSNPDHEEVVGLEWLNMTNLPSFGLDAGLRMHGYGSRYFDQNPKKSFRLCFRARYGYGKLGQPVIPSSNPDGANFNSLVLRAENQFSWAMSGNRINASYVQDQFSRDTQNAMSGYGIHGDHVHLFINGLYWGLYNVVERPDADYCAGVWGGDKEEYDVVKDGGAVRDGGDVAYKALFTLATQSNLTERANYEAMTSRVDIVSLADYILFEQFAGNNEWPDLNWVMGGSAVRGVPWRYFVWDTENAFGWAGVDNFGAGTKDGTPMTLHCALTNNAEYVLAFADRAHRHLFNEGALTPVALTNRYGALAQRVRTYVFGESARWGAYRFETGSDTKVYGLSDWDKRNTTMMTSLLASSIAGQCRTDNFIPILRKHGLYPQVDAPEFTKNAERDAVTLTIPEGATVYYTTDGSDPREAFTGAIVGVAYAESAVVSLETGGTVKARALKEGEWSALAEVDLAAAAPVFHSGDEISGEFDQPVTFAEPGRYTLLGAKFNAGLVLPAGDVNIKIQKGTVNTATVVSGALANLTFTGKGELALSGGDTALMEVNDLIVSNGLFRVMYASVVAKSRGVIVNRNLLLDDQGTIDVTVSGTQGYGIFLASKNCTARIDGGASFRATVGGASKCAALYVDKGSSDLIVKGGSVLGAITGSEARLANVAGNIKIEGGSFAVTGTVASADAKVFKADKKISVKGEGAPNFALAGYGEGTELLSAGTDIEIKGGVFDLVSTDDCLNATSNVVISGGSFFGRSLANDVIDANESIVISGGTVLAYTTAVETDGSGSVGLDVNSGKTITITGGTVVAIGGPDSVFHGVLATAWKEQNVPSARVSGKWLVMFGAAGTTAVKLPLVDDVATVSILGVVAGMSMTPTFADDVPEGLVDTLFHGVWFRAVELQISVGGHEALLDDSGIITNALAGDALAIPSDWTVDTESGTVRLKRADGTVAAALHPYYSVVEGRIKWNAAIAVPSIVAAEVEGVMRPALTVDGNVQMTLKPTYPTLWYGLLTAPTLTSGWSLTGDWKSGAATGGAIVLEADKSGTSSFYKIVVRDTPPEN